VSTAQLDASQAAWLAAALPAPRRFNPATPTPYLRRRAATIAARASRTELPGSRAR
jgi:membrane peptidoglycan carboxypeptidase